MSLERTQQIARSRIPQPDSIITRPACQRRPIRTEGDALDPMRMSLKRPYQHIFICIPQTNRTVTAPAGKLQAIRAKCQTSDVGRMSSKRAPARTRGGIP